MGALGLPAELAAARAEILRAQELLSGLPAELDKAARGERAISLAQLCSEIEEITNHDRRYHRDSDAGTLCLGERGARALDRSLGRAPRGRETCRKIRIQDGADNSGSVER